MAVCARTSSNIDQSRGERLIALYLFVFFFAVYLGTSSSVEFYLADQSLQRFEVTKGLAENLDLSIPDGHGIQGVDGKDYSLYGLGLPVLAVPFYYLGEYVSGGPVALLATMGQVAGAATGALVFLFCTSLGYSNRSSIGVAIFYGLGTFAWPFAKLPMMEHVFETFFILLSIYFLCLSIHRRQNAIMPLVISAISYGIALNIRLTTLLALPGLILLLVIGNRQNSRFDSATRISRRSLALYGIVLFPFAVLVLWYNHYRFGSIFETGYQLIAVKSGLPFFSGTPILTGLRGFLLSPGKGLFYYSPVAIFFFFTIVPFYKKHTVPATGFLLIIVCYLLFYSKNLYWHGDWTWGPRYLLAITPLLIIPSAELLDSDSKKGRKSAWFALVYPVFFLSIAIQILAVSVNVNKYFTHLQMDEHISFSIVGGEGVPKIIEPPSDVYFSWEKSPILAHLKYIYEISRKLATYEYTELPPDATREEKIRNSIAMNVFDFWWVQSYYMYRRFTGFFGIGILSLVAGGSFIRIDKLSRRLTNHE